MRTFNLFIAIAVFGLLAISLSSCNENEGFAIGTEVITFNTSGSYAKQDLVLDDLGTISYIPLATDTTCLIGDKDELTPSTFGLYFIVSNNVGITKFDFNGKCTSAFSKKGNGPEEISGTILGIAVLPNEDILIGYSSDLYAFSLMKVKPNGKTISIDSIPDYITMDNMLPLSNTSLLIYNTQPSFRFGLDINQLVSAIDPLPFKMVTLAEEFAFENLPIELPNRISSCITCIRIRENIPSLFIECGDVPAFTKSKGAYLLNDISADTVFAYIKKSGELRPFFTYMPESARKDKKFWVQPQFLTQSHLFIRSIAIVGESVVKDNPSQFDRKHYSINLKTGETKMLDKIILKEFKDFNGSIDDFKTDEDGNLYYLLKVETLLEALEKNQLSGKLKEIAEKLDEEDNPVMLRIKI